MDSRDARLVVAKKNGWKVRPAADRCDACAGGLRCFDHAEIVQSLIRIVDKKLRPEPLRRVA
jgi:hypothetical protein